MPEAKVPNDEWPICTTMGTTELDADWSRRRPRLSLHGKSALATQDWNAALSAFKLAALRDPRNADIQNYIGYAYRRLRQLGPAMGHYQQALVFNPRHRSAHEHLGELYLVLREPAKAEEHLAALERICLIPCSEFATCSAQSRPIIPPRMSVDGTTQKSGSSSRRSAC